MHTDHDPNAPGGFTVLGVQQTVVEASQDLSNELTVLCERLATLCCERVAADAREFEEVLGVEHSNAAARASRDMTVLRMLVRRALPCTRPKAERLAEKVFEHWFTYYAAFAAHMAPRPVIPALVGPSRSADFLHDLARLTRREITDEFLRDRLNQDQWHELIRNAWRDWQRTHDKERLESRLARRITKALKEPTCARPIRDGIYAGQSGP